MGLWAGDDRVDPVEQPATARAVVHLLGRPRVERAGRDLYRFRSRKSWALLAYLVLAERPPTRSQAAALLFSEADDPLRALRWNLAEIRRVLGEDGSLDGDPLSLRLDAVVDAAVVLGGSAEEAVVFPGLGADLLDGITVRGAAGFESWLLSERRRLAAASEAVLHEASLAALSRGDLDEARDLAVRASAMSPLDENHQALLIRLYRLAGDDEAAQRQYDACAALLERELGVAPGVAVRAALSEQRRRRDEVADDAAVEAVVESGVAAVGAGAVGPGVESLRTAVHLADGAGSGRLRVAARLALAEALVHSLRGMDEEGLATLHAADRIAAAVDEPQARAVARAEMGYVDFLRARYDRAEHWLEDALNRAAADGATGADAMARARAAARVAPVLAKATIYLGSVVSDRADYPRAVSLLEEGIRLSRATGDQRREAYGLCMLGRVDLLRGDLDLAAARLEESVERAAGAHWLSFLPWPQAFRGELLVARGDVDAAGPVLQQAFARACQLGDPCWEGISARGLALVAEAEGRTGDAFDLLADARARSTRLEDSYHWLDVHILDAQCALGRRHDHPDTARWVETMRERASRTGMRELTVRAMLHAAALGSDDDAQAAALLAADIDNPVLATLVASR